MTARLPSDKHAELIALLDEWANKRWCKLKELQSLVGKLNHACAVVPLGRTFLRRLLDLLKGHSQRRCEALPTMHCDLGATLYIIDFSALVAHCSAGLRSVRRSVN